MTMGMDMSPLFSEVVACMSIQVLEIKKMVRLQLNVTIETHTNFKVQVYLYLSELASKSCLPNEPN